MTKMSYASLLLLYYPQKGILGRRRSISTDWVWMIILRHLGHPWNDRLNHSSWVENAGAVG